MLRIETVADFESAIKSRWVWPGGYPTYYRMADGGVLCFACAYEERPLIKAVIATWNRLGSESFEPLEDRQWRPVAREINWEDSALSCDHCGAHIESAYGW